MISQIKAISNGARFFRADMHIHSFGCSPDVKDTSMTPEQIVATAVSEKLQIIAITDHNEIANVERAIDAASSQVLVIPGVELSTPEGHLLVYFKDSDQLSTFFGRLDIVDKGTQISRCQTAMLECLKRAETFNGFAILAHVDGPGGLAVSNRGNSPHIVDILCHPCLVGIELKSVDSQISYSDSDPDYNRKQVGVQRRNKLGLGTRQNLARVLFSDSHSLSALGKNAAGDRKVTRIKMDAPSFDGILVALEDSDARVRLEDQIPKSVPYVMGIKFDGGFLDGQTIHLSKNLNCIIGGRGAGKSTAFEAIRCLAQHRSPSRIIDSEIWSDEIHLIWTDEAEQNHLLVRRLNEHIHNLDDPEFGPTSFHLECYGQGETALISQKAESDPSALLEYLDRFVEIQEHLYDEDVARQELLENQSAIEKAELEVAKIPQYKQALQTTKQQLQALEKAQATEVIKLERKVATERSVRQEIQNKVTDIGKALKQSSTKSTLDELRALGTTDEFIVGKEEFGAIIRAVDSFESKTDKSQSELLKDAQVFEEEITKNLRSWKSKEATMLAEIEKKRKDLEKSGIRLDMAYIRKLADDEAKYTGALSTLKSWDEHLKKLRQTRALILKRRWDARSGVATSRVAFARKASKVLKGALADLSVSLKFIANGYSPEAERIIQDAMSWRTVQVPRAALIVEQLTVPKLLDALKRNDSSSIKKLTLADGTFPFSVADAREIVERLRQPQHKFALERCIIGDLPRITVTKEVTFKNGTSKYITREFHKLSLGQQQSVLLALMLSSDSNAPLIIDQPEDNLDGEFIYYSLVPVLRRAKERRQIIVVTHNANIAVLGDAELIIALKAVHDHARIVGRGSIDEKKTKEATCQILEGAKEAFKRRAKIYGEILSTIT